MNVIRILLFLLIFSSSCSSHRIRHESVVENERMEERAEWKQLEDSIRTDWLNVRHLLRLSDERRQVWIWPVGEFSFQLDSGFVGSASVMLVEEDERSVQVEEGSRSGWLERVSSLDSSGNRSEMLREMQVVKRKDTVMSGLKSTLLILVMLPFVLLLGVATWTWWRHRLR